MAVIEIDKLTKYYGKARGIIDVSFTVEEGEIFGFIGPNGAGKSTTIRSLLGLIFPTSGKATIFGRDCITYGPQIRKHIGYLPSEVFYYDKMKVLDLLKYSASFYKKDTTERMYELAELMELDVKRKIEDLSYGNKKKVGIVQGLLHEPELIILDEPTSGLDPLMQQKFFDLMLKENEKGTTIFFSSHILGEVQELCNRVAIIKEGKIIQVEDMKSLRENNYKKFCIKGEGIDSSYYNIEGISEVKTYENEVNFYFNGDVNQVIDILHKQKIKDILIQEPTLEEVFIHYYK